MVWMVLPRPISSARMVSVPWAQENRSQFRPSSWYRCSVPPVDVTKSGCSSYFIVGWRDRKGQSILEMEIWCKILRYKQLF